MTSADDRRGDEDVWAQAVAEDAAAQYGHEEPRRREQSAGTDEDPFGGGPAREEHAPPFGWEGGPELGPLVDEVRRFAAAVGERVQEVTRTLGTGEGLDQLAAPLRDRHPEVYRHLAAAGGELLAAYRSAVSGHERRWSAGKPSGSEHIDLD